MLSVVFFLIAYAVIGIAAVPLAMRLVPPNNYFGLRTPRTMDSASHWYLVHAVGGQLLLVCCGLAAIILMMYQGTWLEVVLGAALPLPRLHRWRRRGDPLLREEGQSGGERIVRGQVHVRLRALPDDRAARSSRTAAIAPGASASPAPHSR